MNLADEKQRCIARLEDVQAQSRAIAVEEQRLIGRILLLEELLREEPAEDEKEG